MCVCVCWNQAGPGIIFMRAPSEFFGANHVKKNQCLPLRLLLSFYKKKVMATRMRKDGGTKKRREKWHPLLRN